MVPATFLIFDRFCSYFSWSGNANVKFHVHLKGLGSKEKIKLNFLTLFDNLLSKYLIFKIIFACNGRFGLFNKTKKGSETTLLCTLSAWYSDKNVPYLILYQWTKFQCHAFFPSQDIKQNSLFTFCIYIAWWM